MTEILLEDGSVRPALVPYLRVSTEDKGQDPKRQLAVIGPWAQREGFILLAPEEEKESASKVAALERPYFVKACERAKAAGAAGLVIEVPDRFSRMDPMLAVWEFVEVERRYGLEVYFACVPLEYQRTPMGRLVLFLQMASAHQWVIDHTSKVVSGMLRRKAEGVRFGRKPKKLSADEIGSVRRLREDGKGWEAIAAIINDQRKVHMLTDKKEARERGVSSGSLRRMAREGVFGDDEMQREAASENEPDETISSPPEHGESENEVDSSRPEGS